MLKEKEDKEAAGNLILKKYKVKIDLDCRKNVIKKCRTSFMENAMQITFHIISHFSTLKEQDHLNVLIAPITEKSVVFLWVIATIVLEIFIMDREDLE
jgi:hypothetical protein